MKKITHIALLILFPVFICSAQLYTSTSNGLWTVGGTWDIGVPAHNQTTGGDSISIESYITLVGLLDVKSGTTIIIRTGDTLKVDGNATFRNGSVVTVESDAALWITGNINNQNNSNTIIIDGALIVNGDFGGGNGSEINGAGTLVVDGDVSTSGSGAVFGSTADCSAGSAGECSSSAAAPLPVTLVSFNAHLNNGNVELNWATATEINNDFFTIEKSQNLDAWEEVSTINGAGNSSQLIKYDDTDYQPFNGTSYYRLKQTDFNGDYSYSNIVTVNHTVGDKDLLSVIQNPVFKGQTIDIKINNTFATEIWVVIRNINGQAFYSKVFTHGGSEVINIPTSNKIPSGIYFITASSNNQFYSKKLVIQ